jgi:hypothetical protein
MSKLNSAIITLKDLIRSTIESPRCTFDALRLLPAVAQGLHYSRSGKFAAPPERPEGVAPESNPLTDYFNSHLEGPGLWKWMHYFDIYHRHFKKFIGREVHVLEVGIYSGGSLGMWREYFGKGCQIYGMDIEPACKTYEAEGIKVFIGDQSDRAFWKKFRETVPKIDVVIDDGSHDPEHQRITLEEILPHISPGGVYLCEDIGSRFNRFGGYVSGLACHMNTAKKTVEEFDAPMIPSEFQASVKSVIQYPFVTVIEKHDFHPGLFISKKHGTEWQPY